MMPGSKSEKMGFERDEPLTPAGRLFTQPAMHQIINCLLGLQRPIDLDTTRTVISDSLLIKHPRFSSLLVTDDRGREYWRKSNVNLDHHIILHPNPVGEGDDEAAVNDYLADLSTSCPLTTDKPLWEIHLLPAHKCLVVRVHHALGDGISLMSLMLTMGRKVNNPEQSPTIEPLVSSRSNRRQGTGERIWQVLKMMWFTLIYAIEFLMRSAWVKDEKTPVTGGEGVELWPRKIATAKFSIQDMKAVKSAIPNATINDVLFGVISLGLSRYLDNRSSESLQEGVRMTGVALVNLRPTPGLQEMTELMRKNERSRWGNKIGMILLPIYYDKNYSDPLGYLKRAKTMLDRKKLSLEGFLSYKVGYFIMTYVGARVASLLNYRIVCNTSFTISNVVGPKDEFTIGGIPVTYIRTTSSSLPHAITMHMVSYAGKADMQILVAKDLIPDPQNLAKYFEDALVVMKEAAV